VGTGGTGRGGQSHAALRGCRLRHALLRAEGGGAVLRLLAAMQVVAGGLRRGV